MTDIDRYRQGAEHSAYMARKIESGEIRQFWLTIEWTYRFLLSREERVAQQNWLLNS